MDTTAFYAAVTEDAKQADADCPDLVREGRFLDINITYDLNERCITYVGFKEAENKFRTEKGRSDIVKHFKLCNPVTGEEWDHFSQYARNAWTMMAMCDYPYASNFLAPLPGYRMLNVYYDSATRTHSFRNTLQSLSDH